MFDEGIDLLHPELLSASILISLLLEKGYDDTLYNLTKIELLELFNNTILPLPQRNYRQNRRGTVISQSRELKAAKRKMSKSLKDKDDTSPIKKPRLLRISLNIENDSEETKKESTGSVKVASSPEKAKAQSCVNFERKVIKLGKSPSSSSTPSPQSHEDGTKTRKPIVFNENGNKSSDHLSNRLENVHIKRKLSGDPNDGDLCDNDKAPLDKSDSKGTGRKMIQLINNTLQSSSSSRSQPSKSSTKNNSNNHHSSKNLESEVKSDQEETPKKKHKAITWP